MREQHKTAEKEQLRILEAEQGRKLAVAKRWKAAGVLKKAKKQKAVCAREAIPVVTSCKDGDWVAVAYDDRWYPGD